AVRVRLMTALAAATVLLAAGAPPAGAHGDPLELSPLAPALRHPHAPRARAARGGSVLATLQRLARAGAISEASAREYSATYLAAQRSLGRLSGTRREELAAVLANVRAIDAAGGLSASRAPALFL